MPTPRRSERLRTTSLLGKPIEGRLWLPRSHRHRPVSSSPSHPTASSQRHTFHEPADVAGGNDPDEPIAVEGQDSAASAVEIHPCDHIDDGSITATQQVIEVTTTAPTAVLGEQLERVVQPQLALTGTNSSRLLTLGALLVVAGLAITFVDRFAAKWRRTN